jgi:dTDP-6-deoxy-L-talose 4-dehydrogenase (NAD+)
VSFAWCRLFYLHGAGDDPRRLVPYIERQLAAGLPADLSAGHQIRDYMDVAAAGAAIAGLALSSHAGAANVCSGVPVTIRQMAERIAARHGRPDLLRFGARPAAAGEPDCILGVPTPVPAEQGEAR